LWEPCVGGHINWQTDYFAGAVKEVFEETGILVSKNQIKLLKIYQDHEHREFRAVFYCELDVLPEQIKSEVDEVEKVEWVEIEKFGARNVDEWISLGYEHEMVSMLAKI
jgi:8-oxo-dGTP pyrophosphatase MutT (NUDIX family)